MSAIIRQELLPEGIRQIFANGEQRVVPYPVDENGEEYVELVQPHQFPVRTGAPHD